MALGRLGFEFLASNHSLETTDGNGMNRLILVFCKAAIRSFDILGPWQYSSARAVYVIGVRSAGLNGS